MTIIKPGKIDTKVLCGTCERCECEVQVAAEECKMGSTQDPNEGYIFVNCPTQFCGEQIRIYAR